MNKYKIKFTNAPKEKEVECDDYIIDEGFVTLRIGTVNVFSVKSKYVEQVTFSGEKIDNKEVEELRNKFKEMYSK